MTHPALPIGDLHVVSVDLNGMVELVRDQEGRRFFRLDFGRREIPSDYQIVSMGCTTIRAYSRLDDSEDVTAASGQVRLWIVEEMTAGAWTMLVSRYADVTPDRVFAALWEGGWKQQPVQSSGRWTIRVGGIEYFLPIAATQDLERLDYRAGDALVGLVSASFRLGMMAGRMRVSDLGGVPTEELAEFPVAVAVASGPGKFDPSIPF